MYIVHQSWHLEDWQIKWKHVCPLNWLQMRCLQAGGRGKRQLPRSQIGKVGDSPFYWTNILIFQSEHFKAKSLLFSANLGENSLIWKQFYSHIYANYKTFAGVDLSFWQTARILRRIYKFYIIWAIPIGWESDHCFLLGLSADYWVCWSLANSSKRQFLSRLMTDYSQLSNSLRIAVTAFL